MGFIVRDSGLISLTACGGFLDSRLRWNDGAERGRGDLPLSIQENQKGRTPKGPPPLFVSAVRLLYSIISLPARLPSRQNAIAAIVSVITVATDRYVHRFWSGSNATTNLLM